MPRRNDRRVVVTGLGGVSPLGLSIESSWQAALQGVSGIRPLTRFNSAGWPVRIAGEVVGFDVAPFLDPATAGLAAVLPPSMQFGVAAAVMACRDARLDVAPPVPERCGVSLGALTECIDLDEVVRWFAHAAQDPPGYIPIDARYDQSLPQVGIIRTICDRWNCQGPYWVTSTACAAGTMSLGTALRAIRRNEADVILAGGFDSMVTELSVLCFALLGALSTRNETPETASRPFSASRDGFVLGEGGAVLVLEELEHARRRGATIYAELAGYGASMTSAHITDSAADGRQPAAAMRSALADARLGPADIQYINAHGTSTRANDASETKAIRSAFGAHADRLAVSSTKSMTGHLVHAAGALEAAFSVLALRDQMVPPTINLHDPDPQCDLDYVPLQARPMPLEAVMSNSFAFGGNNAAVVFRRFHEQR